MVGELLLVGEDGAAHLRAFLVGARDLLDAITHALVVCRHALGGDDLVDRQLHADPLLGHGHEHRRQLVGHVIDHLR